MSEQWTLANVFSRRARERAGGAPTVAGTRYSPTHAHGAAAPVLLSGLVARRCTVGVTARSVAPEGLFRSGATHGAAGGEGPFPHRGTRHGNDPRRGQVIRLAVTQQPESSLRQAPPAAVPDVGITAALPGEAPGERRGCARVEPVDGAVITTGGELAALAPVATVMADSEDPDPAPHANDAVPTPGEGRRRGSGSSGARATPRPTTLP